jgi:hypothetical protein
MITQCPPPGLDSEPAADELPSPAADLVGFLWERYRQYGRIFTVHLGQPTVFMVGPEAVNYPATTWTALVRDKHGTQAVRSSGSDEACPFTIGEHLRSPQIVSPAALPLTLNGAF